jgi:hypothetical protein
MERNNVVNQQLTKIKKAKTGRNKFGQIGLFSPEKRDNSPVFGPLSRHF